MKIHYGKFVIGFTSHIFYICHVNLCHLEGFRQCFGFHQFTALEHKPSMTSTLLSGADVNISVIFYTTFQVKCLYRYEGWTQNSATRYKSSTPSTLSNSWYTGLILLIFIFCIGSSSSGVMMSPFEFTLDSIKKCILIMLTNEAKWLSHQVFLLRSNLYPNYLVAKKVMI